MAFLGHNDIEAAIGNIRKSLLDRLGIGPARVHVLWLEARRTFDVVIEPAHPAPYAKPARIDLVLDDKESRTTFVARVRDAVWSVDGPTRLYEPGVDEGGGVVALNLTTGSGAQKGM